MTSASDRTPRRLRSLLFVPGNRPDRIPKAFRSGADAVIIDLEDAVPVADRTAARATARAMITEHRSSGPAALVRVNPTSEEACLADLTEVVVPGLFGIVVPKITDPFEVRLIDRLLAWLEQRAGLPVGSTVVVPLLETAQAIVEARRIGEASPRVAYLGGLATRGGDVERSVGYRWSPEGHETLTLRSNVLLAARAAGVPHPVTGLWTAIEDLDGLRRFAVQGRDLGYEGMVCIHPTHVAVINEAFSVTAEEAAWSEELIDAVRSSAAQGRGALRFRGHMVDRAMLARAQRQLDQYRHDRATAEGETE